MVNKKIKIKKRDLKENVKVLRREGWVPGVLYGVDVKNTPIKTQLKELSDIYKELGSSSLLETEFGGKGNNFVFIQEYQQHPLSGEPIHIDFYKPNLKDKIVKRVPLEFVGASLAVKNKDGVLVKNIHELEVKAFPQDMPYEINVDISALKTFEDIIRVKDLPLMPGVEVLADVDEAVVLVEAPRSDQELEGLAEAPVENIGGVEGVTKEVSEKEKEQAGIGS